MEKDLPRVQFHQEMVWGFFCVEENQGIISTTPITAPFILLNACITCIIIENGGNYYLRKPNGKCIDFSGVQ